MFDNIAPGSEVRIFFTEKAIATETLAMQARYDGSANGVHRLTGVSALAGVEFTTTDALPVRVEVV